MPIRKIDIRNILFDLVRNEDTLFGWEVKLSSGNSLDASPVEAACAERVEKLQYEIRSLKIRIAIMKRKEAKGGLPATQK